MSEPSVSALVLNYDGRALLDTALPSLLAQTYSNVTITVIDNGSSDGSAAYVRERWPSIEVLELPVNVGVAAALNRGVEVARGELVALLNNDIELEPDWLEHLVAALDEHPTAASSSGKLLRFYERDVIDAAGDGLRWSGAAINRGNGERDEGQYDVADEVLTACAGAALYRQTALAEVGPFDEDFYAYLEDVDWGLRAQLLGYGSRYVPAAVGYHMRGATTGKQKPRYRRPQRRNQLWLLLKNYPTRALLVHAPEIVLLNAGVFVQDLLDGVISATLRGWLDAVRGLPKILRKRRAIQGSRRVGLERLNALVIPEPWARGSLRDRVRATIATAAPIFKR
ncbi:glycosyltransferase family 2 protein [Solirubrobacter taibaiensis]|nr:glycosyltransferase family 2 protein [Solirubrobacter taibaiensis]